MISSEFDEKICRFTISPTAVSEMFSSCVWDPNFAAVLTQSGRQRHGITGKKSVTTNCKHWKAMRIKASLQAKFWSYDSIL